MWHLYNIILKIAAGWVIQLNGDVAFKLFRCTVALLCLCVNSLGNMNNTICWAIIPVAESADVMKATWKAVQYTAMWPCKRECSTCAMVKDLLCNELVLDFLSLSTFESCQFEVDLTLSAIGVWDGAVSLEILSF